MMILIRYFKTTNYKYIQRIGNKYEFIGANKHRLKDMTRKKIILFIINNNI